MIGTDNKNYDHSFLFLIIDLIYAERFNAKISFKSLNFDLKMIFQKPVFENDFNPSNNEILIISSRKMTRCIHFAIVIKIYSKSIVNTATMRRVSHKHIDIVQPIFAAKSTFE